MANAGDSRTTTEGNAASEESQSGLSDKQISFYAGFGALGGVLLIIIMACGVYGKFIWKRQTRIKPLNNGQHRHYPNETEKTRNNEGPGDPKPSNAERDQIDKEQQDLVDIEEQKIRIPAPDYPFDLTPEFHQAIAIPMGPLAMHQREPYQQPDSFGSSTSLSHTKQLRWWNVL
ncbi:hypothetical protein V1264_022763 [Littorina saxatilis]|uniref:Uncharacterized protein n=2 Tax=Littorina saxatilis TaxID=31220 RepID=A0AAN9B9U8_9CAEN